MDDDSASAPSRYEDEAQARLLDGATRHAARLGWTSRLVAAAAREAGLSLAEAQLLLPEGPRDLAALLARKHDRAALVALASIDPAALKIRERIRAGVIARCDAAMFDEGPLRAWTGFLSLPPNIPLGLRLAWASADGLWRWAGDTATDENHYSKRALLAEILVSTLAVRQFANAAAAARHLDRRIAGVMAFERWKASVGGKGLPGRAAAALGRMRYGRA